MSSTTLPPPTPWLVSVSLLCRPIALAAAGGLCMKLGDSDWVLSTEQLR